MIFDNYFIALDVETGGFDEKKNPITQVCMIVYNNQMEEIESYTTLVKPYNNLVITEDALKVTGLKLMDIHNGVEFTEVYKRMAEIFKKYNMAKDGNYCKPIIIGHNAAKFDIYKMIAELFRLNKDDIYKYIEHFVFDTLYFCRIKWGTIDIDGGHTLEECCSRMGIEINDAHDAEVDTRANGKLAAMLIEEMRSGVVTQVVEQEDGKARLNFQF